MRQIKDYDEDYVVDRVGRMTPLGLFLRALGVVIVLSLILGVVGFVAGWFDTASSVISPTNVKDQWRFAYDYDSSLQAIARQDCTAKKAEAAETDPVVKTQRTSQRIAIENNYDRVAAEYNGRLRDAFRAKLVKPSDVPTQAPTLEANLAQVCS